MLTMILATKEADGPDVDEILGVAIQNGIDEHDDVMSYVSAKESDDIVAVVAQHRHRDPAPSRASEIFDALVRVGVSAIVADVTLRASCERDGPPPLPVRSLFIVPFALDVVEREEIDRFYEEEHQSILLTAAHWLRIRRFYVTACYGAPWTDVVVHDLASASVLQSPEVRRSQETEWRQRLSAEAFFTSEQRYLLDAVIDDGRNMGSRR